MSIFSFTDEAVARVLQQIKGRHHRPLVEADVKVQTLFAMPSVDSEGEASGHALTQNGYQVLVQSKILNLKDRLTREHDCEILIDRDAWEAMDRPQQAALLDHALMAFEVAIDEDGNVKRDALERPKMRIRKHDRFFGAYDEVAQRHGANAIEVQQVRKLADEVGQFYLPGFAPADVA